MKSKNAGESRGQVTEDSRLESLVGGCAYNLPVVLTAAEAADFLRVNSKTVYAAIAAGQMPGRKVGHRTVILRDAMLEWLRQVPVLPQRKGRR